jgi:hypothetical protein
MRFFSSEIVSKGSTLALLVMALASSTVSAAANTASSGTTVLESTLNVSSYAASTLLGKIGIASARALDVSELAKLNIKNGLVLDSVSGASAIAGVRSGDVLVSINGRDTRFGRVNKLPNNFPTIIVLLVIRENERLPIAVQLPPGSRTVL